MTILIWRKYNDFGVLSAISLLLAMPMLFGCVPLAPINDNQRGEVTIATDPQAESTSATESNGTVLLRVFTAEPNTARLISGGNLVNDSSTSGSVNSEPLVGDRPIIEIISPRGIGTAEFIFDGEVLPQALELRFALNGMEQLHVTTSAASLVASVSSLEPTVVTQEMALLGDAQAKAASLETITQDSPFWLTVSAGSTSADSDSGEATQAASSSDADPNMIEVIIPEVLIAESGGQISVAWVDFYR